MKLAHIFPIASQELYQQEDYVMILAHLVKAGLYKSENFSESQYIILDNGLFEKAQVSTKLEDIIKLAESSEIPVKEIIIPDAVNDVSRTQELFLENLETVKAYGDKYKFMYVAQASTYEELEQQIDFINKYDDLNLSVGYSKLSPLDRGSYQSVKILAKCNFPIHLLGLKSSFKEVIPLCHVIRGCDSSQTSFIAKNWDSFFCGGNGELLIYERDGEDIDLAVDEPSMLAQAAIRNSINGQLKDYGILENA